MACARSHSKHMPFHTASLKHNGFGQQEVSSFFRSVQFLQTSPTVPVHQSIISTRTAIRTYTIASRSNKSNRKASPMRRPHLQYQKSTANQLPPGSQKVVTSYEELPNDYQDEDGLSFRETPLSTQEVHSIFGVGFSTVAANKVMRIIHGRRVAGTLADPLLGYYAERYWTVGLKWLRINVPVDEEDSAAQRALAELAAMESDIVADGTRLGLYKNDDRRRDSISHTASSNVYGRSGLDEIQEEYKRKSERFEAAKKRAEQAAEIERNTGTQIESSAQDRVGIELRRPGQNPLLKHYLEKAAAVAPDIPPEMSAWNRLLGSAIVMLSVIGGSALFAQVYVPPPHSTRLWQDLPPAAATILGLILLNTVVFFLWHIPPAFAPLNKYFLSVPGYPRGLAVLGNIFSHQTFTHLFSNMFVLWIIGTRLHDDMGRAHFLSLYLSCGVIASFASLSVFVAMKNFRHTSLGASGAICGIVGYYLWTHFDAKFRILNTLPPEPYSGIPGWLILSGILSYELYTFRKSKAMTLDHYAHWGGYVSGISAAMYKQKIIKRQHDEAMRKQARRIGSVERGT